MIQSVRTGLTREARALIAADVVVQTNRAVDAATRAADSTSARRSARSSSAPRRSRRRRWCAAGFERGGRADGGAARRPGGVSVLRQGRARRTACRTRTICSTNRGALVRPDLLTQLGAAGRRSAHDRRPAVHDPRRDLAGAGPARRRLQLRLARDGRLRRSASSTGLLVVRQPRQRPDAAARRATAGSERAGARPAARLRDRVRQRALVPRRPRTRSARTSSAPRTT